MCAVFICLFYVSCCAVSCFLLVFVCFFLFVCLFVFVVFFWGGRCILFGGVAVVFCVVVWRWIVIGVGLRVFGWRPRCVFCFRVCDVVLFLCLCCFGVLVLLGFVFVWYCFRAWFMCGVRCVVVLLSVLVIGLLLVLF